MTSDAALELTGTVPAGDLLPGARIRGGDRYAYTMVNRQVNGNIIVRREIEGARATLRPTDRVVRPPGLHQPFNVVPVSYDLVIDRDPCLPNCE